MPMTRKTKGERVKTKGERLRRTKTEDFGSRTPSVWAIGWRQIQPISNYYVCFEVGALLERPREDYDQVARSLDSPGDGVLYWTVRTGGLVY